MAVDAKKILNRFLRMKAGYSGGDRQSPYSRSESQRVLRDAVDNIQISNVFSLRTQPVYPAKVLIPQVKVPMTHMFPSPVTYSSMQQLTPMVPIYAVRPSGQMMIPPDQMVIRQSQGPILVRQGQFLMQSRGRMLIPLCRSKVPLVAGHVPVPVTVPAIKVQPSRSPKRSHAINKTIAFEYEDREINENGQRQSFPCYTAMIAKAILSVEDKRESIGDIYDYIEEHYPGLAEQVVDWKTCVSHNLEFNECFVKIGPSPCGRGKDWIIHPSYMKSFGHGDYRKKKACSKWVLANLALVTATAATTDVNAPSCPSSASENQTVDSVSVDDEYITDNDETDLIYPRKYSEQVPSTALSPSEEKYRNTVPQFPQAAYLDNTSLNSSERSRDNKEIRSLELAGRLPQTTSLFRSIKSDQK